MVREKIWLRESQTFVATGCSAAARGATALAPHLPQIGELAGPERAAGRVDARVHECEPRDERARVHGQRRLVARRGGRGGQDRQGRAAPPSRRTRARGARRRPP